MLKLRRLHLENFKGFVDTTIDFENNITCIAGINGAGKSSILQALVKSLSLVANRASLTNKKEYTLKRDDIHTEETIFGKFNGTARIEANFSFNNNDYVTVNSIDFLGGKTTVSTNAPKINFIENTELPMFAFYSATRKLDSMESLINKESAFSDPFYLYSELNTQISDYKDFFNWFKTREDIENERILYAQRYKNEGYEYDMQLETVRYVISKFFGKKFRLRVSRTDNLLIVENGRSEISFSNLSDGEKSVLLLIGDIARRLAIVASFRMKDLPIKIEDILNSNGIVLIDEIELHLHPSWQRKIGGFLTEIFPNCQFIITTHSPQVLGELQPQSLRLLDSFKISIPAQSFGLDTNSIIKSLMKNGNEDFSKNFYISKELEAISDLISKGKYLDAKEKLRAMDEKTHGSTPDSIELMAMLTTLYGV